MRRGTSPGIALQGIELDELSERVATSLEMVYEMATS
jgi:hypothetical protein